jgi:hypothetical protein
MAVEYTWTIPMTEYTMENGGIFNVHWRVTAQDGDFTASSYGTCGFTPDAQDPDFVPYESLTEDVVLGWIWDSGIDKYATEAALAAKIDAQKNPTTSTGVPW